MARNFGYALYFVPLLDTYVDLDEIAVHEAAGTGLGVGGFIDRTTLLPASTSVTQFGTGLGETYGITLGQATKTVTNAALVSNVATLTVGADHPFTVGSRVVVANLPSPFASLNGTYTITASNATTISYAKTGTDITSASVVAGTATGGNDLKLDGTDHPVRLLGIQSGPPTSETSEESEAFWDDVAQGFEIPEVVSKSASMEIAGKIDFSSTAYKLMRLCEKGNVSQGLMAKMALIGPRGYNETIFSFGRFNTYTPDNSAGATAKFTSEFRIYGAYGLNLHNG
jgi:hypothetical protein